MHKMPPSRDPLPTLNGRGLGLPSQITTVKPSPKVEACEKYDKVSSAAVISPTYKASVMSAEDRCDLLVKSSDNHLQLDYFFRGGRRYSVIFQAEIYRCRLESLNVYIQLLPAVRLIFILNIQLNTLLSSSPVSML